MYITRAEIKSRAKEILRNSYWYSFGVIILVIVLSCLAETIVQLIGGGNAASVISSILALLVSLFVMWPLSIGLIRFFIKTGQGNIPQVNDLFYVYKNGLMNTVFVMLSQVIFIFLWSLLLVIPGIIKSYQYFMIDYMLAENPRLERKRAFEITKEVMKGNKWRTFVLGLSFIGWILLGVITFGIGIVFLMPYVQATYAQYYLELKKMAIENGIIKPGELDY